MPQTAVRTGVTLNYEISGEGDPLLLVMGRRGPCRCGARWSPGSRAVPGHRLRQPGAGRQRPRRGCDLGGVHGRGHLGPAGGAEIPRAHAMGWSLGSAVVQELALSHPDQVASAVLLCTWAQCDGFQRSVLTALRHPYAKRDMEAALTTAGIAFSPELLDHPDFAAMLEPMLPAFPQTDEQMQVTVEQWDADLAHDTTDRLAGMAVPTLVIVGEQDLLTPPWQSQKVADAIPGAEFELLTGPIPPRRAHRTARRRGPARHRLPRPARDQQQRV